MFAGKLSRHGFNLTFILTTLGWLTVTHGQIVFSDWDGSTGNWGDVIRWSSTNVPNNGNGGFLYDVEIDSGRVTIDSNITLEAFEFSGQELNNDAFTLTVNSDGIWDSGILQGEGTSNFLGYLQLENTTKTLRNGHTINIFGDADWFNGDFNTGSGAVINNHAGSTFRARTPNNLLFNFGGVATNFNNLGTFKSEENVRITAVFNNTGNVDVQCDELSLSGGGNSTGDFMISSGATLRLEGANGGHEILNGSISGGGDVVFARFTTTLEDVIYNLGGSTFIENGTVNFYETFGGLGGFQSHDLVVSGGTFNNEVNGVVDTLSFSGGTISGQGWLTVPNQMDLFGGIKRLRNGQVLVNQGTANWTSGDFSVGNGIWFINESTGTLDITTDADFLSNAGGFLSEFTNSGIITKRDSVGTTRFTSGFENDGQVDVTSGVLELAGPTINSGVIDVSAEAALQFGAGGSINENGSQLTGGGDLKFFLGTHELSMALTDFTLSGDVEISGGNTNVILESDIVFQSLTFTGNSTRSGSSDLAVEGEFNWFGGTLAGNAATSSNGPLNLDGATKRMLGGQEFINAGEAQWVAGDFSVGQGARFTNSSTGLFEILDDLNFLSNIGGAIATFDNQGTFSKSGGDGISQFSSEFLNSSSVKIEQGTLRLAQGMIQTGGTTFFSGGNLEIGNFGIMEVQDGSVFGDVDIMGDVIFTGGIIDPGTNSQGTRIDKFSVDGDLTISAGSTFDFEIQDFNGVAGVDWDVIGVSGTVDLTMAAGEVVNIELNSLAANGNPGDSANFMADNSYCVEILTADSIVGFDTSNFVLDTTGFNNVASAMFSVELLSGNPTDSLVLKYSPTVLLGDINLDGLVNLLDVSPFIALLASGGYQAEADMNQDGAVNLLDIALFVDVLSN